MVYGKEKKEGMREEKEPVDWFGLSGEGEGFYQVYL